MNNSHTKEKVRKAISYQNNFICRRVYKTFLCNFNSYDFVAISFLGLKQHSKFPPRHYKH